MFLDTLKWLKLIQYSITPLRALAGSTLGVRRTRRAGIIQCVRRFPRGRGKQRPGRARSPGPFGVRVKIDSPPANLEGCQKVAGG